VGAEGSARTLVRISDSTSLPCQTSAFIFYPLSGHVWTSRI
jgi:hypothetical protein